MNRKWIFWVALTATVLLLTSCTVGKGEPPTEETQAACETDARALVGEFAAGDYDAVVRNHSYSLLMKLTTGKAVMEKIWTSIIDSYGAFQTIYGAERILHEGSLHSVIVKVAFKAQCIDFRVTYNGSVIAGIHYAPNEDDPTAPGEVFVSAFSTRELTFGETGWELTGTLTLPDGEGPWPVAVIVHGSGPLGRDGRVVAQTPYRDIAEGLARRGIASFRYDKRTYVYGSRMTGDITVWEETVNDAALAAIMLRELDDTTFTRVVVIGHSLGGMLLPRIAGSAGADAYIALAAAATPLHRMMVAQYEYFFSLDGVIDDDEQKSLDQVREMADHVDALARGETFDASELFGVPASYWNDLAGYDPVEAMAGIGRPLLMLQGEGDYQVTMSDFARFEAALSGKEGVTMISYPGLSHLFTPSGDPPSPDDYRQSASFDETVLDDMAAWILALR
jgi:fermentation-respiration switch protein FrsA (DUF1100 family)